MFNLKSSEAASKACFFEGLVLTIGLSGSRCCFFTHEVGESYFVTRQVGEGLFFTCQVVEVVNFPSKNFTTPIESVKLGLFSVLHYFVHIAYV